jgi:hypothetical protein
MRNSGFLVRLTHSRLSTGSQRQSAAADRPTSTDRPTDRGNLNISSASCYVLYLRDVMPTRHPGFPSEVLGGQHSLWACQTLLL